MTEVDLSKKSHRNKSNDFRQPADLSSKEGEP